MRKFHSQAGNRILVGFVSVLVSCMALNGCSGGKAVRSDPSLQWPPLPKPASIAWVNEIGSYRDAGISKGFWSRLADAVMGAAEQHIGRPYGIYADTEGRLFVVDVDQGLVHVMDTMANSYTEIGTGEKRIFQTPIGITGDTVGTVYITDSEAGLVYRYTVGDRKLVPFITGLKRPTGIAYNPLNRLIYVSETLNHRVAVYDESGVLRFAIGGRGDTPGKFNFQTDLFIDARGKLYVTDPLNARIQIFSPDGKLLGMFGRASDDAPGDFMKPKGVAVDSDGNIYVCDALRDNIQVYGADGEFLLAFGRRGQQAGKFWMPSGLFIDRSDTIYVADTYNSRVQVFRHFHGVPLANGRPVTGGEQDKSLQHPEAR